MKTPARHVSAVLAACLATSLSVEAQTGIHKLFASDATESAWFGGSGMDLDRGRLFVAATTNPAAAVYVFELRNGEWSETAKLARSSWPGFYDAFGTSVSASGASVAIGGPGHWAANRPGLVYVFDETSSGWIESAQVEPPGGGMPTDRFGFAVVLEGDLLVVGAPGDDRYGPDAGAVFVFRRPGAGGAWSLEQAIAPPGIVSLGRFGTSVALDGERLMVGSPAGNPGSACTFRRQGGVWVHEQTLTVPADGDDEFDGFGFQVCLEGDTAAVSAPFRSKFFSQAGEVFVFRRGPDGWERERRLIGKDYIFSAGRYMGLPLAMHSDVLVAGAEWWNAAFAFRLSVPNSPQARAGIVMRAGPVIATGGENYGAAVAIDERWIAIGVRGDDEQGRNAGAVYLLRRTDGDPPFCCNDLGESYCNATSSTEWHGFKLDGSLHVADDSLYLQAGDWLLHGSAFLMMAPEPASISVPGQLGTLCLGGGILRLGQGMPGLDDETLSLSLGTRAIPGLATGIVPGSTWYFQGWYSNNHGTSGFTSATSATFQ